METNIRSSSPPSIVFVGGGQMAAALISGLARSGRDSSKILVIEPSDERREVLSQSLETQSAAEADHRLRHADAVVWAVKPQVMCQAIQQTIPHLGESLHISIAAGISTATLGTWLGTQRVVRAMPNTPALVGLGVTGLAAAQGASASDKDFAQSLLSAVGKAFWVESDDRLDAITAVSGSGPAYVFHFLEAFQAAAEDLGFSPEVARDLVLRTAQGAIAQAEAGDPFSLLRERVTSKRGTTEAGIGALDARNSRIAMHEATAAAYRRAGELSKELSGQP